MIKDLEKFKGKKIAVIGDILLDKFTEGIIERLNPDQTTSPLVKIKGERFILGGAANVANNILSLGGIPTICCVLGKDENANIFSKLCVRKNIILRKFVNSNPTICKQRLIADNYQVARMDFGENKLRKINLSLQNKILKKLKKDIKNFDAIVLSDYDKMIFTKRFSQEIIKLAKEHNIPTIIDPKPENISFFKNATAICPNKAEAKKIIGEDSLKGSENQTNLLKKLKEITCSKYVIVTCGSEGVIAMGSDLNEFIKINTIAKSVRDVTGAGDTFAAALALGFASKISFVNILKIANSAAGIVVEKPGTATVDYLELKNKIKADL